AELLPSSVLALARHTRHAPVGVHHRVRLAFTMRRADAEAGSIFEGVVKPRLLGDVRQVSRRSIEDRKLHAARNVDSHGIGGYRIVERKNAADGQAIADV